MFDAPFFSITAKEAAGMDPMQRKLLEVAYEAFENGSSDSIRHPLIRRMLTHAASLQLVFQWRACHALKQESIRES